jgi:hypothetical protein
MVHHVKCRGKIDCEEVEVLSREASILQKHDECLDAAVGVVPSTEA